MSFVRAANICTIIESSNTNDFTFWDILQLLWTFPTFLPFTIISDRYIALIFNMLRPRLTRRRKAGVFKFLQSEERS